MAVDRDFGQARVHFDQAIDLGAAGQVIEQQLGNLSYLQGDLARAASHYRAALAAGGRTQDRGQLLNNLAVTLSHLGEYGEALKTLEELQQAVRTLSTVEPWVQIRSLAGLGDLKRARAELDAMLAQLPPPAEHDVVSSLALIGPRDGALGALQRLEKRYSLGERFPFMEAFRASVYLGDVDGAFRWLNRAIDQREREANSGTLHAREFVRLRDDPRFAAALERIEGYLITYD